MPLVPTLEVLFAVIVWGASFVATKVVLQDVSPNTVVWLRFGLGIIVLGLAMASRRQFLLPKRSELGYFAFLGFLGITFHQWLQSNALLTIQASTSAWIVASTPVFMAILGRMVLKEHLSWPRSTGIILAAMGVLLVVTQGDWTSILHGRFGTKGDFLMLVSAPNWAVFSVISRRGLKIHPAARMIFFVMTFGWVFNSFLFFQGNGLAEIPELTIRGWFGVLFLGIFCSGLAYIAWYDALSALPSAQTGAFLNIEPLVSVAVAAVLLGETATWASLVGGMIILLGVYLVNRENPKPRAAA